ncbi:MAG: head GIN domain-containing protein [Bacteroidia bacterium]
MKNFKNNITLVFLSSLMFFSACKKENMCDCFKRTGDIITETRSLKAFDRLQVEQNVNVFLTQDPVQEVKIEAGEHLMSLIQTVVEDGTLIIRNKNTCNWARAYNKPLNVYIKTPGLSYIKLYGTGNIKSLNTIVKDTMDISITNSGNIELTVNSSQILSHIYGYGDLTLHGTAHEHSCSIGGTAFLYAKDLTTSYTWIQSYTLGTCYVDASSLLICRFDDKGDIYCYGHPPSVQQTHYGSGQLYIE